MFRLKNLLGGTLTLVALLLLLGCGSAQTLVLPTAPSVSSTPTATLIHTTPFPVPATFTPIGFKSHGDAIALSPVSAVTPPISQGQVVFSATPNNNNANEVVFARDIAAIETRGASNIAPNFPPSSAPLDVVQVESPPQEIECDGQGMLLRSQFPSDVGGPLRNYHAYLPPCYGVDGRSYPTLYLFHGSIQTDTHWIDLGLIEQIELGIREERYPPFIVIMPFNGEIGNITSGNDHSIEGITVNSLIPYIDEQYCTWNAAAGRSIGGISRGGYWALEIAFRHEELFTAVSGHSSQLRFETDRAEYNPLSTYADADLSQMRIWLDWGIDDFLHTGQEQLRDSLLESGANLDVYVNRGGHNDEYWLLHIREYLDWHTAVWPTERDEYPLCK